MELRQAGVRVPQLRTQSCWNHKIPNSSADDAKKDSSGSKGTKPNLEEATALKLDSKLHHYSQTSQVLLHNFHWFETEFCAAFCFN